MKFKDYYQTLGVPRDAAQEDIKRAYRKLARKYHPDVSSEPDAEARFKEVGEAYEVLKDPEKRAAYDQFGDQWKAGQEFHPPPDWDAGFEFRGGGFTDAGQFSDFFEELFGRAAGGPFRGTRTGGFRAKGEDHHARVVISLEDAFHGATRTLNLSMPELDAQGRVAARSRNLNVKIPKGVTEGQRIRLSGQGGPGIGGGPNGDLYLEVSFEPHPIFHAQKRDIHVNLPVAPWEAALGATVPVPTLGGKVELRVPPGSQTGTKLRLRGRGLPGSPAGDQYVVLEIVVPKAQTPAARELYEKMEREMAFNPRAQLGV
jgi:curved DNA-binding protein